MRHYFMTQLLFQPEIKALLKYGINKNKVLSVIANDINPKIMF